MKTLVRTTFPKIRIVERRGEKLFQVDARRKGTNGTQKHFSEKDEALKWAAAVEAEFNANGSEGLALSQDLRAQALRGEAMLAQFNKTVGQACEFYRDHLLAEQKKKESALVGDLAAAWYKDKSTGMGSRQKPLKRKTLTAIRQASDLIKRAWSNRRILEITPGDVETFIDSLTGSRRKKNVRDLTSQFFNWCAAKSRKHVTENPCDEVKFHVPSNGDIHIFNAKQAERVMRLCETDHKDLIVYSAVSLFAGLRPGEVELLDWENIHLEERQITVLGITSKPGETHNVRIEDNLYQWLKTHQGEGEGPICPRGSTLTRRRAALHAALGYKAAGANQNAEEIPQDISRHSYASHWLAKYGSPRSNTGTSETGFT